MDNTSSTDRTGANAGGFDERSHALETANLVLTLLPEDGGGRMAAYYVKNREHLGPWEVSRAEAAYTPEFWDQRIAELHAEAKRAEAFRWILVKKSDPRGPILGTCALTQIVRGPNQSALLGYGIDREHVGRGMMSEAVRAVLRYAFGALRFKRVMANYLPTNERSGKLLQRLGFVIEGYAREYVFINGAWRDHILTSLLNPDPAAVNSPPGPTKGR